jgi:hypothetical protein
MVRTWKVRCPGADFLDLDGAMAVYLSGGACLFARTGCENHDSAAPHCLDVGFRVPFDDPKHAEISSQSDLEIIVSGAHESITFHLKWLAQDADLLARETTGFKIANNIIRLSPDSQINQPQFLSYCLLNPP